MDVTTLQRFAIHLISFAIIAVLLQTNYYRNNESNQIVVRKQLTQFYTLMLKDYHLQKYLVMFVLITIKMPTTVKRTLAIGFATHENNDLRFVTFSTFLSTYNSSRFFGRFSVTATVILSRKY